MPDLTPLATTGITGVCLALIILFGFTIRWFVKVVSNHIDHNTKVLTKLEGKIDYDIKAQKETTNAMREVKEFLIKTNGK